MLHAEALTERLKGAMPAAREESSAAWEGWSVGGAALPERRKGAMRQP